jgi:hypothetical protein
VAFYSDKHTVFRVAQQGREVRPWHDPVWPCLNELNIEILCANSSQAKGRVERANRTLQDRLVKELRLAGLSDMDAANAFLPAFMERYNAKFAKTPRRPDNLHRPLNTEPDRLADVLCWRDERYVGNQLAFSYDRQRIILAENEVTRGLPGKYVDSFEFPDGRLEFRWKGVSLPYSVFDKDQRVTHAAITENKHLSAVLEFIKENRTRRRRRNAAWANNAPATTEWPSQRRLELAGQTPRKGGPRSQPGLRYLRSPPCQATLPLRSKWNVSCPHPFRA